MTVLPLHTWGPEEGAALVCLHGFLGTGADWAALAVPLPGVRVLAPDLPGHGEAVALPDEAYTFEGAAAAVLATLDAAGVTQAALLGYSMGGRLALNLALEAPERFSALVLESASPGLPTEAERAARRVLDGQRATALQDDLAGFLRDWYRMPLFATLSDGQRTQLEAGRGQGDAEGLARALVGLSTGAQPDLWERLPRLAVPTTVVVGAHDAKFVALAHRMQAAQPALRVEEIWGAGHNVHLEAPEAFAATVRTALGA